MRVKVRIVAATTGSPARSRRRLPRGPYYRWRSRIVIPPLRGSSERHPRVSGVLRQRPRNARTEADRVSDDDVRCERIPVARGLRGKLRGEWLRAARSGRGVAQRDCRLGLTRRRRDRAEQGGVTGGVEPSTSDTPATRMALRETPDGSRERRRRELLRSSAHRRERMRKLKSTGAASAPRPDISGAPRTISPFPPSSPTRLWSSAPSRWPADPWDPCRSAPARRCRR